MSDFYIQIVNQLKELFEGNKDVLTAWEGGSAATGYLDEYSDLDLAFIVKDDAVEPVFEIMEKFLSENFGIKNKFRMPEPNWHGHSQCFYILEKSPEYFYVDFLIEKESSKNRFMESNRHGNAIIWFDKENLYDSTSEPRDSIINKCKRQFEMITAYLPFTFIDLRKQIVRGNSIDAFYIYFSLVNRFVVLLNIKYRPAKYDFGMRYLHRDFPVKEAEFIDNLLKNSNLSDLEKKLNMIIDYYEKLKPELLEILG